LSKDLLDNRIWLQTVFVMLNTNQIGMMLVVDGDRFYGDVDAAGDLDFNETRT
jgi:hypothetical protein